MDTRVLTRQFERMGARLTITLGPVNQRTPRMTEACTIDIDQDRKGEIFVVKFRPDSVDNLELFATDVRPSKRHLLLNSRPLGEIDADKVKILCGHDERHWFAANIPPVNGISTIEDAMEALKPPIARISQREAGVKPKDWNDRKNAGFIRQGEWFFIPEPRFNPFGMVLHDEPIRRGNGKPHIVQYLSRSAGEAVYVSPMHPTPLTQGQYNRLLGRNEKARKWTWELMRRNPVVYAFGKVRHADHATIRLPFWHRVVMSGEQVGRNVAFLD